MLSNHLILCCPFLLPSVFPITRVFPDESVLPIRWPKYWSFSFSISPSNEYSGLIFFRIDWFDLLAVQGMPKSLPQHHSLKASILQRSAFLRIQLSHLYVTAGKTIALTRWTFVSIWSIMMVKWIKICQGKNYVVQFHLTNRYCAPDTVLVTEEQESLKELSAISYQWSQVVAVTAPCCCQFIWWVSQWVFSLVLTTCLTLSVFLRIQGREVWRKY